MGKLALIVISALFTQTLAAEIPMFGNPAYLIDNGSWLKAQGKFRSQDSETRALLDLVTILYDWDNERPWGAEYIPTANNRLGKFRETFCADAPEMKICSQPGMITNAAQVATAQAALVSASAALEQRLNIRLATWFLPLRPPQFSLIAASSMTEETATAQYWDLAAEKIVIRNYEEELLPDAGNYRAGFDSKNVPAMYAVTPEGLAISDRQLRQRAVDMAEAWKHEVASLRRSKTVHPIAGATELQFQRLLDDNAAEFERVYAGLSAKVAAIPNLRQRFERDRAQGDYPEEVYQHVAFKLLSDATRVQGSYLVMVQNQKTQLSAKRKALESILTVQRYSAFPKLAAMDLSTLIQPMEAHGFLLDEVIDSQLAQTYVLESLRAVLGLGNYAGQEVFPKVGAGLINQSLFDTDDLALVAPEAAKALNSRQIASLAPQEQLEILRLYIEAVPSRIQTMALMRMGTLFFSTASDADLKQVAGLIGQRLFGKQELQLTAIN